MGSDRPRPPRAADRAFAGVFGKSTAAVRRILKRLRIPEQDLPDLEQDTWLAVWQAFVRLDGLPPSEPVRFSTTIAHRKAVNHIDARRRRPEQAESSTDPELVDETLTSEEQIMQSEEEKDARALVLRLLDDLPLNERSVVVLADFEPRYTMAEIAGELGISEEAARSRHRRARERMKEALTRRKGAPLAAMVLLPAVAKLDLDELLAIEAPPPPLSAREHARVWERVMSAIGGKALAAGGAAVATMLTAKQAAAGALFAFALGGAADEALRALLTPEPRSIAAEMTTVLAAESAPQTELPSVAPTASLAALPAPSAAPVVASGSLGAEWQAIRDARALLHRKPPSPEAALEALARVHAAELRSVRDRLRAEAESSRRPPRP